MCYYPILSVDKMSFFAILRVQRPVKNPHRLLGSVITVIYSRAVNTIWVITNKLCLYSIKLWPTVGSHKFSEIFLKLTSWTEISLWHDYSLGPHNSSKYDVKIKYPKNMFLFTAFLFHFSHFHTKITPATKIIIVFVLSFLWCVYFNFWHISSHSTYK